jgi:3',5'-nucleoside bisphosphate phosphatase
MGGMIDLQAHSRYSDGQLEPADVARAAAEAGVTVMSLTDHDAVGGVPEASEAAAAAGIENVPAVEMSCVHRYSDDLHVLGYWVDLEAIAPACARAQQQRVERAREIVERLRSFGIDLTFEDVVAEAGDALSVGRPHIAKPAMARSGFAGTVGEFFEEYLVPGAKAFVARRWPTADGAVELIHAAGGVAVVAHPYWDVKDPAQVRDLVATLRSEAGLEGLESFYPAHTREHTAHCLALCSELELVPTGSSDFHGPTHKTFARFGAYDTYGLGEPQVPPKP